MENVFYCSIIVYNVSNYVLKHTYSYGYYNRNRSFTFKLISADNCSTHDTYYFLFNTYCLFPFVLVLSKRENVVTLALYLSSRGI